MFSIDWDKALNSEVKKLVATNTSKITAALKKVEQKRANKQIGFMDVSLDEEKMKRLKETSNWIIDNADELIVLGIGGSSLGGRTIVSALTNRFSKKDVKVSFVDNVDPDYFNDMLKTVDLSRTVFNVISKSGSTAETMSQFLVVYELLCEKLGKKEAVKRIIITTDPEKGALRPLEKTFGFRMLEVPQNVGGRFSALTDVGLLPAITAGIDIEALISGANDVASTGLKSNLDSNLVLKYSLIKYAHYLRGCKLSVMMPYSTKLADFSTWYVQLWAESLGKNGKGQTPICATGATDQHSQLQLFMEGPKDKFITFIGIEKPNNDVKMPKFDVDVEAFSYLSGHTMQELIRAEMLSTQKALHENGVPSVRIELPRLDAYHIGALFMFFEMSVAVTGELLEIDAFNQPGVELSKNYTYQMMGRRGY